MGNRWGQSKGPPSPREVKETKETKAASLDADLDLALALQKRRENRPIELLLLGCSRVGKTCILRHLNFLHDQEYARELCEKKSIADGLRRNCVDGTQRLLVGLGKLQTNVSEENKAAAEVVSVVDTLVRPDFWNESVSIAMSRLSREERLFGNTFPLDFMVPDGSEYLLRAAPRIGEPTYIPTQEDVLHAFDRTKDVEQRLFRSLGYDFLVTDCGGTRKGRRLWRKLIDRPPQPTAVLFVVSLSEYTEVCFEDDSTNRMHESLRVWKSIAGIEQLRQSGLCLLFNKSDLFAERLGKVPLTHAFPEYKGENAFVPAYEYIKERFLAECKRSADDIVVHPMCALGADSVLAAWEQCLTPIFNYHFLGSPEEVEQLLQTLDDLNEHTQFPTTLVVLIARYVLFFTKAPKLKSGGGSSGGGAGSG